MSNKLNNNQKLIDFWKSNSDEDFDTMMDLYQSKRYNWSLFIGHITLEKILKAYFIKTNNISPPFTHNLLKLAKESNLELTEEIKLQLSTITAFNINTRYDDYKQSFYKKCTAEYTKIWIDHIIDLRSWIEKLIQE